MRQFAGFGTAKETNLRFRYLLDHGQTGLSTAFDMPSLMGHDSDHPRSLGEVGREGVAIDSVADMARPIRPADGRGVLLHHGERGGRRHHGKDHVRGRRNVPEGADDFKARIAAEPLRARAAAGWR